jgi:protease II
MSFSRFVLSIVILFSFPRLSPAQTELNYPETRTVEHVDVYHGVKVPDPYRWLEDDVRTSKDVAEWVNAQNEVTFKYLEELPERKRITKRLTDLWNYEKFGSPFKRGGRWGSCHLQRYYATKASPGRIATTCSRPYRITKLYRSNYQYDASSFTCPGQ